MNMGLEELGLYIRDSVMSGAMDKRDSDYRRIENPATEVLRIQLH